MSKPLRDSLFCLVLCCSPLVYCDDIRASVSSRIYVAQKSRWPNGIVYFDMDPYIHKNHLMKMSIMKAIEFLNQQSCLKFVQRWPWDDKVQNYVTFILEDDTVADPYCAAEVGYYGRRSSIWLGSYCYKSQQRQLNRKHHDKDKYLIFPALHEMLHAVGFGHEQLRADRDCFVWVSKSVSLRGDWAKSRKPWYISPPYDFPYDYQSAMQYVMPYHKAHPHDPSKGQLGRDDGTLSDIDVWKIQNMYCGRGSYCQVYPLECHYLRQINQNNPNCTPTYK